MFGKYRIISTLGTGSSSTVYLAEHLKLKLYRAIKCIPKDTAQKAFLSLEDSFPTEAFLLKNLKHAGIPLIYDIDEDDDSIYIIEEFIQGDSLDVYLSYQENFSGESVIMFSIQLCDILDYLHHLSPYPILYQDLKPEHIIVCGNQLKLVDFGIASFFTGSDNQFQYFGTDGFTAPEALNGHPASPLCDIYSLGKIMEYMINSTDIHCSDQLLRIVKKACASHPKERFKTTADLMEALCCLRNTAYRQYPHLIRNIHIAGSKSGIGTTHIAVSFVSALNKLGISSIYMTTPQTDRIDSMVKYRTSIKEKEGIYFDKCFYGLPAYGDGVAPLLKEDTVCIKDCGCLSVEELLQYGETDILVLVLSGSEWDISDMISLANRIKSMKNIIFICNYGNRKKAKLLAKLLNTTVYCFPCDKDPFCPTPEKERLIVSALFRRKGGRDQFLALIKRRKKTI